MESASISGLPCLLVAWKSSGVNSSTDRSRALVPFVAADDPLLLVQSGAVPGLDAHPDAPGHQIAAAGQPGRPVAVGHPHVLDRVRRCPRP